MASIYQSRKDGKIVSFKFKAFLGRDASGKQITKCTTWTPPKAGTEQRLMAQAEKEATIWERKAAEAFQKQQEALKPDVITFEDFVNTKWMPTQMSIKDHRASTVAFHEYLLKVILPYFGSCKLQDITAIDMERYMDYLKNTYKTKQGTSPSPKTIRHHYATLHLIFNYAVNADYISANPLDKISTPKLVKHKVDALSKSEAALFVKEIETQPLNIRLMYTLLLTTGIRRGECFGLQWRDVDFENRSIHINRNVTYTAREGVTVGLPKTNAGLREIPLTAAPLTCWLFTRHRRDTAHRSRRMHFCSTHKNPRESHTSRPI